MPSGSSILNEYIDQILEPLRRAKASKNTGEKEDDIRQAEYAMNELISFLNEPVNENEMRLL